MELISARALPSVVKARCKNHPKVVKLALAGVPVSPDREAKAMQAAGLKSYCFEGFTLDLKRGCVRNHDREIDLRPKSFEVLRYLVENAGRLVSKDELVGAVWPDVIVTDESLTRCVSEVRLALGDSQQRIIKTVPRRGYLFAAPIYEPAPAAGSVEPFPQPVITPPQRRELEQAGLERRLAERRHLTVMACELGGLAALSARLDPEDLQTVTTSCQRHCAEIINRHHGYVTHRHSDGLLAYFGYPDAREHDAENAVRAGLVLIRSAVQLGTELNASLLPRVGIASGVVVIGDEAGTAQVGEQIAVGETPHLAGRLQAIAEAGSLVIADSTRRLVGEMFDYRDLGRLTLPGLVEPARAWQVLGPSIIESRFEAQRGTRLTPLVGREEELELLLRRWQQAKAGDGSVALLSGEPGIGKSRIIHALLERLGAEPYSRLRLFCSPHHQHAALYPTITQLERAAGFQREDTDEQRLDKLEAVLTQATNDLSETAPLLAQLLSVPTEGRYRPLDLTAQRRKEKTFNALIAQLAGLAAPQPVVMVYEDAQWIDPTSLELLDLIVDRVPSLPVLLIITFRPEFTPPWVGRPQVTLLSLSRLPHRQRAEMLSCLTGGKPLPSEIAEQIVHRTDGVPLFIEELTKAVVESGDLADAGDHYTVTRSLSPLAIPTTLHASLMARLDRLASVREVAQIGAAVGRHFSHELISAVAPMPQKQLDDGLAQLVRAELVFCRGTPPDAEYTFKHALVQDAAYSTLLRGRRQQLHARIAEMLERQFPEIVATDPSLLAQHCTEAGIIEKAVNYWLVAGQQSLTRSALVEAVAQLRKGLALVAELPEGVLRVQHELDLQVALGKAIMATKGYAAPEAGEVLNRARSLCEQLDRPPQLVSVLHGQWVHVLMMGDLARARSRAEELLALGTERNDPVWIVMGCRFVGVTCCWFGEFDAAREYLERGLFLYDPAHRSSYAELIVDDSHVVLLAYMAWTLQCLGYLDQARAKREAALAEARLLSRAFTLAHALMWVTSSEAVVYGPSGALLHADEWVSVTERQSIDFFFAQGTMWQGWCRTMLGQPEKGVAQLTRGLAALRAAKGLTLLPLYLTVLADAYREIQQPQHGLTQLDEAISLTNETQARTYEAETHRVRGELLRSIHDNDGAEASLRKAIDVAQRQSAKLFELRASTSLARLWRDQGKRTEARDLLAPIYGWFTEGFDTPNLKEAKILLDELAQ
jgi:class 3 adenylate cyclase/predicted ATPase